MNDTGDELGIQLSIMNMEEADAERSTLLIPPPVNNGNEDDTSSSSYESIERDEEEQHHVEESATATDVTFFSSMTIYMERLVCVLSLKYLLFLGIVKLFICGIYANLIGACFLPVFQRLGVDAATEQVLILVCTLPYSGSPLFGIISDVIPIGGYHKKYWMAVSILAGASACAILGFDSTALSNTTITVTCMVFMNLELAVLNLLNEGKYCELIRIHPYAASDIVSFTQACAAIGSLFGSLMVGPLSDAGNLHAIFYIAFGLSLVPLFPTLLGWLPEKRRSIGENGLHEFCAGSCLMIDADRCCKKQDNTIYIALLVGICGPTVALISAYMNQTIGITIVAIVLLLVLVLSYTFLSKTAASVVAYTIVTKASSPSMRSALQYFYTANESCLPNGPHFSYTYYITYNGIVGEVFMLLAIAVYQTYMTRWSYRSVLLVTLTLASGGRLVDVAMVYRWNVAIGIPDSIFFLLGSSMLESMTSMLHLLPFQAIVGKICPPGTETATFAFVAGVSQFSSTFSSLAGSSLMNVSGLKTMGGECDFSQLPLLIIAMCIVLPIAAGIPAIYYLIPYVLQSESFPDIGGIDREGHTPLSQDEPDGATDNCPIEPTVALIPNHPKT